MKEKFTKEIIDALCLRFDLKPDEFSVSDNLFNGTLDSLDFLEYAKTIESLCHKFKIDFSISDFLYDECLSIQDIVLFIEKTNPQFFE